MIWYRPGLLNSNGGIRDKEGYIRAILNALDEAVYISMTRTNDIVGQYDLLVDVKGTSLSSFPGLRDTKRVFSMLQDHFPDRLGTLFVANLSGAGRLFLRMIMPLITQEVRDKIRILPPISLSSPSVSAEEANADGDGEKINRGGGGAEAALREMREAGVDGETIPDWLGGPDRYRFRPANGDDPDDDDAAAADIEGFDGRRRDRRCTDEEGMEYINAMPYHA